MEIKQVPIEKLKRDNNQPRTVFDQDRLLEMAQSITTEGVINAIEVDNDYKIITGESRFRAAKLAGLKTVPCKFLELEPRERFRRQMVENLHINSMNDWDIAKGLAKLLDFVPSTKLQQGRDAGISHLAVELGKSEGYIRQHLDRLNDSAPIQKAMREGTITYTHARELQEVPELYKAIMEKKILAGEFKKSNSVTEVKSALNRNPEKAAEILAVDYSQYKTTGQVIEVVTKISPRAHEVVKARLQPGTNFIHIQKQLLDWLHKNRPEDIVHKDRFLIILGMSTLVENLNSWGKEANQLKLK